MKLESFAGIFSRFFVVGFFAPAFFGLVSLSLLLTADLLPDALTNYAAGTQLLVLGGLAIPVGLVLEGFHVPILRGLSQHRSGADLYRFLPGPIYRTLLKPEQGAFGALKRLRDDEDAPMTPRTYEFFAALPGRLKRRSEDGELSEANRATLERQRAQTRTTAAWRLEERYPAELEDVLPTRFGNAMRASQEYCFSRWGLDTWAVWPRIEALLTEAERDLLTEAQTDVAFFLNAALTATAVGSVLIVDEIWHTPLSWYWIPVYLGPFVLAYILYRLSVGAVIRWGSHQRACVDLHRLELFDRLGLKLPPAHSEQYVLARALNRFILYRPRSGPPDQQNN